MFGKFSLDSLALAAFGVDAESFKNAESAFVKNASRILTNTFLDMALIFLKFIPGVPFLLGFFKINIIKLKQTKIFIDMIIKTIEDRRQTKERKNDMIDLMMDCIIEKSMADENDNQFETFPTK